MKSNSIFLFITSFGLKICRDDFYVMTIPLKTKQSITLTAPIAVDGGK